MIRGTALTNVHQLAIELGRGSHALVADVHPRRRCADRPLRRTGRPVPTAGKSVRIGATTGVPPEPEKRCGCRVRAAPEGAERGGRHRHRKVGRVRRCRIEPKALRDAERWLSGQRTEWERQLDQLDDYLKGK